MGKKSKNAWVQRQAVPFYTQIKDLDKRASTHPTQYQHFVKTQPFILSKHRLCIFCVMTANYRTPNNALFTPVQNGCAGMERILINTKMQAAMMMCMGNKPAQNGILPSSTASRSKVKPF